MVAPGAAKRKPGYRNPKPNRPGKGQMILKSQIDSLPNLQSKISNLQLQRINQPDSQRGRQSHHRSIIRHPNPIQKTEVLNLFRQRHGRQHRNVRRLGLLVRFQLVNPRIRIAFRKLRFPDNLAAFFSR